MKKNLKELRLKIVEEKLGLSIMTNLLRNGDYLRKIYMLLMIIIYNMVLKKGLILCEGEGGRI